MTTKAGQKHDAAISPVEFDFAVKAIDANKAITVDGPVIDDSDSSSKSATPPSALDSCSVSDEVASYSLQPATKDGTGDTLLEDSKIAEEKLESIEHMKCDSVAELGEAVESDKVYLTSVIVDGASTPNTEINGTVAHTSEGHAKNGETPATPQAIFEDPSAIGLPDSPVEVPQGTHEMIDLSKPTEIAEDQGIMIKSEDTVAEPSQQPPSERSVPPPIRLDVQLSQLSLHNPPHSPATALPPRYADFPRAPRQQYSQNSHNNYRSDGGGREDVTRLNALLMKTRNELEAERKKSASMRRVVEFEKEKVMDAALSEMTKDLLNKQAETLTRQEKVAAKERELKYRQTRIDQLEVYLSEGQKQVYRYNEGLEGESSMIDVDREYDRRQAELRAQKSVADVQARVNYHQASIQQREAALQMREQQYKALIRSSFEAEMREKAMPDMEARLKEVADVEYNSGFGAGKVVGRAEGAEEARQKGFLEGYGSCHRAQVTLSKMRQGLIPHDSPELDFVYDSAHPCNPFIMGARVGGADCKTEKTSSVSKTVPKQVSREKEPVVQKKTEERVRKLAPPARPTFASELRGAQNMHNGHFVLANGSGPASPAALPEINGEGHVVGEASKGSSQMIRYEQEEESNLIDLY